MNFLINLKYFFKTKTAAAFMLLLFFYLTAVASESVRKNKTNSAVTQKTDVQHPDVQRPSVPKIKPDEYALFLDDKYIIFKTQKTDELELDLSCYKKNKKQPECMALTYAKMKAENVESPNPAMNNMAAFHCAKMNGRNLLAVDSKRNEKDFCRFPDQSMVSSWSMYLRQHPTPVLK